VAFCFPVPPVEGRIKKDSGADVFRRASISFIRVVPLGYRSFGSAWVQVFTIRSTAGGKTVESQSTPISIPKEYRSAAMDGSPPDRSSGAMKGRYGDSVDLEFCFKSVARVVRYPGLRNVKSSGLFPFRATKTDSGKKTPYKNPWAWKNSKAVAKWRTSLSIQTASVFIFVVGKSLKRT
jgi:hypothetical protein